MYFDLDRILLVAGQGLQVRIVDLKEAMLTQEIVIVTFSMIKTTAIIDILPDLVRHAVNGLKIIDAAKGMMQHQFCSAIVIRVLFVLVFREDIDDNLMISTLEILDLSIPFVIPNRLEQSHILLVLRSATVFLQFGVDHNGLVLPKASKRNDASLLIERAKIQRLNTSRRVSKIMAEKDMTDLLCRPVSLHDDLVQNLRNVAGQRVLSIGLDCVQQRSTDLDEFLRLLFLFGDVFGEISDDRGDVTARRGVRVCIPGNGEDRHVFAEQGVVANRLEHGMLEVELVSKRRLSGMLLRKVKPADQIVGVTALPSPQAVLRSAFGVTLISIQRLRQLTHDVRTIVETKTAGMNRRWGQGSVRIQDDDLGTPVIDKLLLHIAGWSTLDPQKTMYVTAAPALPFISIPVIFDLELLLQNIFEEHFPAYSEILRYDVRILLQELSRDGCFSEPSRGRFVSLFQIRRSMIVEIASLHVGGAQREKETGSSEA